MLQWIIGASTRARLLVVAAAATLLAVGVARLPDASIEALPDFGPVRVEVQTEALGLSPEEAENLITNPMEQEFFTGIPWLHKIRSNSAPGLSAVEMIFEPGTNDVRARQVVQERLTMVPALPAVSKPPYVIQPAATTGRVMIISMSSKDVSLIDMSTLARWKVRQRLLSVPGVANVSIWGLRDRQLQVLIDPHQLRLNGVLVEDVLKTAANAMWSSPLTFVEASTPGTGGFIDTANQRISINHTQPIKTAADLAKVTIESDGAKPMTLGEVTTLVEGHQPLIGDAVVQGGSGLMLVVERSPGTSIRTVTQNVERALEAMKPGMAGIQFDTQVFRAVGFVEAARSHLAGALGIGALLLVLVVGAFFYNWRTALLSLFGMSLSLTAAWLLLSAYGVMLNMMIIAGLVLALVVVVDDAVAGVDGMRRRLAASSDSGPATVLDSVVAGAREVGGVLLTGLVIAGISVLPTLVLTEVSADFIKPAAQTYVLILLVSALVALVATPALAALLLRSPSDAASSSPLSHMLGARYNGLLGTVLRNPLPATAVAGIIIIGGLAMLPQLLGAPLMPDLKDRDLVVRMSAAPGTSLPAMTRMAAAASAEVGAIAGVRSVGAHVGRASNSDLLSSVDAADLWVSLKPDADYEATFAAIRAAVSGHPSYRAEVSAYPNLKVRELTTHTDDDLVVRVYGRKYDVLQAKAEIVAKAIADVPGVQSPEVRLPIVEPTVEVEVNVDKASAKGVKPGDVRRAAANVLAGITAGSLFEEQKIFDVVLRGLPNKRDSLSALKDLLIDAPNDSQVRLGDVADVRVRPNPSVIKHDAVSRYIDVTAKVRGASVSSVNDDVAQRLTKIGFPSEHHVEVMGESALRESARLTHTLWMVGAVIAIFFVLQARCDSWRLAVAVSASTLLPLCGGLIGAATQWGSGLSTISLMGLLPAMVVGVRGSLLWVERVRQLQATEGLEFGPALIQRVCAERFDAVVMATLGGVVVLLPILALGVVAGLEIVRPMAAMLVGGLLAAALANLVVLPMLAQRWGMAAAGASAEGTARLANP